MYHIDRRVLVTLGLLSSAAVSAEAQSTSSGAECPMPVLGADAGGTMPTFMPDSTVRYFIRVMPAMCRNPLASTPPGNDCRRAETNPVHPGAGHARAAMVRAGPSVIRYNDTDSPTLPVVRRHFTLRHIT
jgi:hypothetical protein